MHIMVLMKIAMVFEEYFIVTGGAGFIGSNFLDYFVQKYPDSYFLCLDKLSYVSDGTTKFLDGVLNKPNFEFLEIDISRGFSSLCNLLKGYAQQGHSITIINFAAESCVDRSFKDPSYFITNNILSTQNVLESIRLINSEYPDKAVELLHVSTDEVYGEQKNGESVNELARLNPTNPYAASKASIDLIIQSYQYSYNIPISIVRSNNVYGPRQYPEKIIPMAIHSLKCNKLITIHGDGSNRRNYLHVNDFIKSIEFLLKNKQTIGETYNVGNIEEIDNLSLVSLICKLYFKDNNIQVENFVEFIKDRNFNDSRYLLDFGKIMALGWKPEINLKRGLKDLIENQSFKQTY